MDLKAFYKIYSEAIDALAERRLFDMLSLTEAIFKDTLYSDAINEITELRGDYSELLESLTTMTRDKRNEQMNTHFRNAIELLEMARNFWEISHPQTPHARLLQQLQSFDNDQLLDQLIRINRSSLGKDAYHTALDAAFGLLWHLHLEPYAMPSLQAALLDSDSFARRTFVSALLLGLLDQFTLEKLHLLLSISDKPLAEAQDQEDLTARIAVALTIVYERYIVYFQTYTEETDKIRAFLERPGIREQVPTLLQTFTFQAQVKRVGNQVDDILPIVRKAFEKEQRRLGSDEDEETNKDKGDTSKTDTSKTDTSKTDKPFSFDVQEFHIDSKENEKLFNQLASHARKMDEMRQASLDINHPSFTYLKRFDFFNHPAHWFYPFNLQVPGIRQALTRPNGKPDRVTLSIMRANRFCASDCYSYASMMESLHKKSGGFSEFIDNTMNEMEEALEEFYEEDERRQPLTPYADYCQCLHRYFYQSAQNDLYYHPFAANDHAVLYHLPLFEGFIPDETAVTPVIGTLNDLGAYEQAILLIDFATEHFGIGSSLLYSRGYAFMQLLQWQRALTIFQQLLLMDENPEAELCMARCFEALSQWDHALPLLLNEEKRQGDSNDAEAANIVEETGRTLIQLQRWDDAVQRFFRLEFMGKNLNVARRAIAWCSIHQGKYERAANYYQQLIQLKKATWEDRLNLGHALWLQGLTDEAVSAYLQSFKAFNKTKKEKQQHFRHWTEAFQEDARTLLADHFDAADCALMQDAVQLAASKPKQ